MFEEKKYYCTETENSFTESELYSEYIRHGYNNEMSCTEFVNNCMYDNNGTLETVKELYSIRKAGKVVYSVWNISSELY